MMQIRVGYELVYDCPQPTPMLLMLNVHHARAADIVVPDRPRDRARRSRSAPIATASAIGAAGSSRRPGELRLSPTRMRQRLGRPDPVAAEARAARGRGPARRRLGLPARQPLLRDRPAVRHRLVAVRRSRRPAGPASRRSATTSTAHRVRLRTRAPPGPPAKRYSERTGVCRDYAHLAVTLLPLHEHPGALLHRLSRRHRRAAVRRPDGFRGLVRSLSRRRAGTPSTRATTCRASAAC